MLAGHPMPPGLGEPVFDKLEAELAKQGLKAKSWRLLGYNSPFVPRSKQTHELQALLD